MRRTSRLQSAGCRKVTVLRAHAVEGEISLTLRATDRLLKDSTDRLVEDSTGRPITVGHQCLNICLSRKRALERKGKWKEANDYVGGTGDSAGGALRTRYLDQEDPTTQTDEITRDQTQAPDMSAERQTRRWPCKEASKPDPREWQSDGNEQTRSGLDRDGLEIGDEHD